MMQKKILLLEDDYDLAETLEELLEENGYEVSVVHTAQEAIEASYQHRFNLYVFDINLPDMNGLELLRSLREAEDTTPTIFISALIDLNSISEAFGAGAYDYIKKPFFPQELLIRIDAKLKIDNEQYIEYANTTYNPAKKELRVDGKVVSLGEVQECLCDLFLHNINQVLDKTILMDCLIHPSDTALRVALNKFKQLTHLPIKNVRGIGYILEKS
jgi:DNA-binding response OmpR family regulator